MKSHSLLSYGYARVGQIRTVGLRESGKDCFDARLTFRFNSHTLTRTAHGRCS